MKTYSNIDSLIQDRKWEHPEHYFGETYPNFIVGLGQHRDSDLLDQSNFTVLLDRLGGESDTVVVSRAGHWAVGWVETILVHQDDIKALTILMENLNSYATYPVLDDSDFSEREYEYQCDYAEEAQESLAEAFVEHLGLPNSYSKNKDLIRVCFELNMWIQGYAGNDACIDLYKGREPHERELGYIQTGLKQIWYHMENNEAYEFLCAVFGIELTKDGAK